MEENEYVTDTSKIKKEKQKKKNCFVVDAL